MTHLVTLADPESAAAEAFRALRTNLAFNRPDRPLRSLLVTSPTAVEDGASVAANLAVATAHAGHRVILVDGDLRRPAQHTLFGLDNDTGLAQVLASERGDPLPLRPTDVPGLWVLTAGPPAAHPASLLDGPQTGALLLRLGAEVDIVILSSPPVLAVSDAAVLAPLVDGVLLVLAAGRSRRDTTRAAREALDRVGANVLGVVLTEADPSTADVRY
ncbi:MAG: CpsD/CapB family tyrosine-protein kinase [Ardenticatenales bacterium]|nr:CpsD/CapB family tyrosine-protein kinase [Ardenticatenales bacterium]